VVLRHRLPPNWNADPIGQLGPFVRSEPALLDERRDSDADELSTTPTLTHVCGESFGV